MERKEAIEIIKKNWPDSSFTMLREALETLIPELKESEDKRISRKLVEYFLHYPDHEITYYGLKTDSVIAWLEKQGEQKPQRIVSAEAKEAMYDKPAWSKEDEKTFSLVFKNLYMLLDNAKGCSPDWVFYLKNTIQFIKSLKDRIQSQQEWSDEDENNIAELCSFIRESYKKEDAESLIDWLKSLKDRMQPQNTWKPSDEQMEALDDFIYAKYPNIEKYGAAVKSLLYQDLKKLRKE